MDKVYTKAEYDMLLMLRKKPRSWDYIAPRIRPKIAEHRETMAFMMDDCAALLKNTGQEYWTTPLELNQQGVTVAQAEYDRRFDMYCTRVISIVSLVISAIALAITAISL